MNNYCAFSKDHHCIKWQDYVSARLELEECDELCHGNWIEIESLQRQVHLRSILLHLFTHLLNMFVPRSEIFELFV